MASGGSGKQLDFEFPDSDEASSRNESEREQGTRGNSTARAPESTAVGEKRDRAQELKQSTAKKGRRPCRKRLQEHWRDDRAAGKNEQRSGGKNKERRRELRAELQPAAGESRAALQSAAGEGAGEVTVRIGAAPRLQCGRVMCSLRRVICKDLRAEVLAQQFEIERLQKIVEDVQRGLEDKEREVQKGRHKLVALSVAQRQGEERIEKQFRAEEEAKLAEERIALANERVLLGEQRKAWDILLGQRWHLKTDLETAHSEVARKRAELAGVILLVEEAMTLLGQNEAIEEANRQREAARQKLREEREELDEKLRELRLQELNVGAEMRAEWQGWPGRGLTVSIGPEEVQWLTADARQSGGVLVRKEVKQGLVCFNYRPDTPVKWFSESAVMREGLRWFGVPIIWNGRDWWKQQQIISLRKDCRGLVVAEDGQVVARPVQRVFKVTDLWEIEDNGEGWQKVVAVTEKLDGEMIDGGDIGG